jgi:outer membrane protein assembly complex protein YaeT
MWRARLLPLVLALQACVFGRHPQARDMQMKVVRGVSFKGNKAIDARTLSISIVTTGYSRPFPLNLLGKGTAPPFNEREFRRDVLRLKALYGVRGFPDATVDTSITRKGNEVRIAFLIGEGPPVKIDSIEIAGLPEKVDVKQVRMALPLQKDQPFDRILFATSVTTVEALLHNEGYAFAKVTGGFRAAPDARSVVVTLDAVPGPRAVISRVDVRGNEKIDRRVIIKALSIYPGQVYSYKSLHQSQIDLYRSQMFRQVRISIEDSATHNPSDSLVDVSANVELAEYPLQRARLSGGYGTLDCFRAMGSMDLFNFTGGGRRLEIRAGTSKLGVARPLDAGFHSICPVLAREDSTRLKLNYNLSVTLHEPLLFSRKSMGSATAFMERHTEYQAYLREAVGGELAATRQLSEDVPARLSYSASLGRTVASAATFCAMLNVCGGQDVGLFRARRFRSVLGFEISRDRTNSVLDASQGTATAFEAKWAPALLGADSLTQFTKFSFKFESHNTIGVKNVLSTRLELGTILAHTVNFAGGSVHYAPPEERFYLGGANSVRGFGANRLGPLVRVQTAQGGLITSALGGNFMTMASIEGRFPIPMAFKGLYGAVFVDGGQIASGASFSLSGFRVTPGFGFRITSPLGPIRFDIGINPYGVTRSQLYSETETGALVLVNPDFKPDPSWLDHVGLNFSIGQAF